MALRVDVCYCGENALYFVYFLGPLLSHCYFYPPLLPTPSPHPSLHLESVVDVTGVISAAPEKITGCTQQDIEIQVTKVSGGREGG